MMTSGTEPSGRSSRSLGQAVVALALVGLTTMPASAQKGARGDSAQIVRTAAQFHAALAAGDSALAMSLLADNATILESGDLESRDEYRAHHLPADIAFARAIHSERQVKRVGVARDAGWVVATSTTQGTFEGRAIDSVGAELMLLVRTKAGWRIAAVHWSSHRHR